MSDRSGNPLPEGRGAVNDELRMHAYYYGFDTTGDHTIDRILSAVACAGKAHQHTEAWTDETYPYPGHTGDCPTEWIQNAAVDAAARIKHMESLLRRASKYMRRGVLGGNSQVAAEFLRDIYQEVGPPRSEDLRQLDEFLAKLKGVES